MAGDDPRRRDCWTTRGVAGWTIRGSGNDDIVLTDGTGLLRAELPDPRLEDDTAYLRWCYRDNPLGPAWERYHYVDGDDGRPQLIAHYLIMPRRYRGPGGARSDGAWSQHAVTRQGHQRARHFSRLGGEIYEEAGRAGRSFVVGVTNDKSTEPVVRYMGWRLVGPLPVRLIPALGTGALRRIRPLRHTEVTRQWLDSTSFDDFAAAVDTHRVTGWASDWSSEVLRWRLGCPFTRYWVHVTADAAFVTTRTSSWRLPLTVVLKVFPLVAGVIRAGPTIAAIARHQRSALAVYAGFNRSIQVSGIAPPRRLQPSPLNLIVRNLAAGDDPEGLELDTFELLDMDAY